MHRFFALQKIVETGSFSKAAEAIGYTTSALSQSIASLENELGIKLLVRTKHGSMLTDEGKKIYTDIENIISQYLSIQEKAKEISSLEVGQIRMATVPSVSANWLPNLVEAFHKEHPNIEFILHQGDYALIEESIKNRGIDFGFVSPHNVKGIEVIPVKTEPISAVVPADHPLANLETIPLELLGKEPFILLEMGKHSECLAAFQEFGITPNVKYILHDDFAIMAMVEQGIGVSLLPHLSLNRINYNIAVRPVDPQVNRTISIGFKDKNVLPNASKKFIEFLFDHLDQLP